MHAGGNHPDWFARLAVAIPAALLLVMTGLYLNERGPPPEPQCRLEEVVAGMDRVIPDLDLKNVTVTDVLQEVERLAKVSIVADRLTLESMGIDTTSRSPVHLDGGSVREVMQKFFDSRLERWAHVWIEAHRGAIHIKSQPTIAITRVYDVGFVFEAIRRHDADMRAHNVVPIGTVAGPVPTSRGGLFGPAGGSRSSGPVYALEEQLGLQALIRDSVGRESWIANGGAFGEMYFIGDRLIVTADPRTHAELVELLKKMPRAEDQP